MNYCINCGKVATQQHHVVPKILGGNNNSNLVWLCDDCHGKIHNIKFNNEQLSHSELVKLGIKYARIMGKHVGRKKITFEDIKWFMPYYCIIKGKQDTKINISKKINLSRPTIDKYIKIIDEFLNIDNVDFSILNR